MKLFFPLTPRYRLDDESPWLKGIDPARHYWIHVNGDETLTAVIPGLTVSSLTEFKESIRELRSLQPGEEMQIVRVAGSCTIKCITQNCFAIEDSLNNAPVWHLFDEESIESLLMTSHPDWKCAERDVELGRHRLTRALEVSLAA